MKLLQIIAVKNHHHTKSITDTHFSSWWFEVLKTFKIPLYTWNMMWKCLNCFFLNLLLYFSIDSTFWKFSPSKKFPFPPFYNPPTLVFLLFILTFLYPSPYSLFGEVLSLHLAKERVMKLWPNNSVTEKSFVKKNPWNTGMIHWNEHSYQMEFCLDTRLTGQKKVVGFSASCRYHFCHILTNFYTLHLTSSYQGDKLSTQRTNICHTFPVYAKFLEAVKVFARPYNILLLSFVNSGPAFFIGWKFLCFFVDLNLCSSIISTILIKLYQYFLCIRFG